MNEEDEPSIFRLPVFDHNNTLLELDPLADQKVQAMHQNMVANGTLIPEIGFDGKIHYVCAVARNTDQLFIQAYPVVAEDILS